MKVPERVSSRSMLHSLLKNKLNHIVVAPIKEDMMQNIKETRGKVFEPGTKATNIEIKKASFHFPETV